ncbi:ArsR/SmtB family transcription factor [Streptoalloteichus tenebrarius]|uniref:ArsR/SmtB family transcription factor n=1 Tax=Streptoalloteichus tenebrarius (strain ATCC 17920 / DSM 40477 / JCM 4838 / CBS 697.72 / NBRC 16177 / NCIMB 11028 / NRRL B-12390 / A12253. 1 / ISP 5477) TaxID=1933 RepID=UPI0020A31DDE|nr:metalloregulator ArsR/SmtB family transcription factor [Streptoalloteichus tenebrarius]
MDRTLPQPDRDRIDLVSVLHALADPVRLTLVRRLAANGAQSCAVAAEGIGVTASTASHHYRVLREAGVINVRLEGRLRYVQLRREDLDARFPGLLASVVAAAGGPSYSATSVREIHS